ncbi:MAG: hypothetical protein F6K58_11300 [Symploca sp. SIO2E9]|nr:hypothetical protein [Symploca sp. SIO2E9]
MTQENNQHLSKLQQKADENQEQIQKILDYLKTLYEHLEKTIKRVNKLEEAEKTHSQSPSQPDTSSLIAAEQEFNSLRQENSRLESQIVELRKGQAQLQSKLDALASKPQPDTSSTVAAKEEFHSLRQENSRLESQIVELRKGQAQLQSKLDALASKPQPDASSTVAGEKSKLQFREIKESLNQIQLRVSSIETDLDKLQKQGLRETQLPTQTLGQDQLNLEVTSQSIDTVSVDEESSSVIQNIQTSERESENNSVEESSVSQISLGYPKSNLNPQEDQIVTAYNSKSSAVLQNATQVSETRASLEQRRQGSSQRAIFEKARRWGEFLILTQEGVDYLMPGRRLRITSSNQATIEDLFKLYEYQPEFDMIMTLLKPAIVSSISDDKWELVEPGALKFELIDDASIS